MTEYISADLYSIAKISKDLGELSKTYECRMVLTVWNQGDTGPTAWIDNYPGDSHPTITFEPPETITYVTKEAEDMTDHLIDAQTLWATPACAEGCCDCCNGYCPHDDTPDTEAWDLPLATGTINGIAYYGNRYTLIRTDRIDPDTIPDITPWKIATKGAPEWMTVPDTIPDLSTAPCTAYLLDRHKRSGLSHRTHVDHYVHLYLGREHVGWSTSTRADIDNKTTPNISITPDQYPTIKNISEITGMHVTNVAKVYNALATTT